MQTYKKGWTARSKSWRKVLLHGPKLDWNLREKFAAPLCRALPSLLRALPAVGLLPGRHLDKQTEARELQQRPRRARELEHVESELVRNGRCGVWRWKLA